MYLPHYPQPGAWRGEEAQWTQIATVLTMQLACLSSPWRPGQPGVTPPLNHSRPLTVSLPSKCKIPNQRAPARHATSGLTFDRRCAFLLFRHAASLPCQGPRGAQTGRRANRAPVAFVSQSHPTATAWLPGLFPTAPRSFKEARRGLWAYQSRALNRPITGSKRGLMISSTGGGGAFSIKSVGLGGRRRGGPIFGGSSWDLLRLISQPPQCGAEFESLVTLCTLKSRQ